MKVIIDGKEIEIAEGSTLSDLMRACGLNPQDFLAKRNGKLIHDNSSVAEGDKISTIRVVSGG